MTLARAARSLARELAARRERIVFAESCTAGLASAALAGVAGISQWHCGSAVVYRDNTKERWLGVSPATLRRFSAVSKPVARAMATGVLAATAEAQWSAAITGHLGPDAPQALDSVAYIVIARRGTKGQPVIVGAWRQKLAARSRVARQREAAELVLKRARQELRRAKLVL